MLVTVDPTVEVIEEDEVDSWAEYVGERRLLGSPVAAPDAGRTVRVRGGEPIVTDGPYAETKEFLAGFDLLECDSLEEAVDIASRHPVAKFGAIEVRAFEDL